MEWFSYHWFSITQLRQFTWAHPIYLYAIPAMLLLFGLRAVLSVQSQQRLNVALNRTELQPSLIGSLRYLLPVSLFIAVTLILMALARPQLIREEAERVAEGIDLMLAIDISSSMAETDLKPNRLEAAKRVARSFVKSRRNDRIGLVIFAGEAYSLCPLTTDHDLLNAYLDDLDDSMIKTSGTAIGSALAVCINRMRESKVKSKVTILLSDGDNTAGNLDPVTVARLAKAFNIRIYTVAIGKAPKTPAPNTLATVTVDEGVLTTIATIGSGSFFRAGDAPRLQAVFNEIDRLEKAPVKTVVYKDVKDFYRVYLYWAIVFLLLTLFLKNTIFGNILED